MITRRALLPLLVVAAAAPAAFIREDGQEGIRAVDLDGGDLGNASTVHEVYPSRKSEYLVRTMLRDAAAELKRRSQRAPRTDWLYCFAVKPGMDPGTTGEWLAALLDTIELPPGTAFYEVPWGFGRHQRIFPALTGAHGTPTGVWLVYLVAAAPQPWLTPDELLQTDGTGKIARLSA